MKFFSIPVCMTLLLLGLKLCGFGLSWVWVLFPLWVIPALLGLFGLIFMCWITLVFTLALVAALFSETL